MRRRAHDTWLVAPAHHDTVTVRGGEVTRLGRMTADSRATKYPTFCD